MTTTLSPPIRILGLVGVLAAAGLGLLLFMQSRSTNAPSATTTAGALHSSTKTPNGTTTLQRPSARAVPATPKIVLLPGLPTPIAHALRHSKVVVVSMYAAGSADDAVALAQARSGAASAHAGFAAVNVLNERLANDVDRFAGAVSSPAVLVVRRPGRIVNRFNGFVDRDLVAQAAQNAGARARAHR